MLNLPMDLRFDELMIKTKFDFLMQLSHLQLLGFVVAVLAIYVLRSRKPKGCLDPENFKEFKLVKKTQLTHNASKFRFALPKPTSIFGLPVGQHIVCRGQDREGKEVIRPYTPITLDSDLGFFELVVKMYPNGRMSHYFREMKVGEYLPVKGPKGRFKYKVGQARAFGMIAGGSGITPMFQLTRGILENPKDKTNMNLIYANVTVNDILLKEELDNFAVKFPNRFKVYYVLSQPPETWNGGIGHVSKEMIQTHCPAPASDIQILRCGPPGMNKAMATHLEALGYDSEMQFEF
ncbi:NADH--cytochrome b5 reductase 1-like [Pistacia vera]|uniref:NADH--cytochrome b5 reductase 1-like n=1 Tax=Pistacia vera TaxID=55513 RepID=UPI0012630E47|nr:NADH--cytochrome b5 reductase 1-like [Pistacia vera]